MIRFLQRRLTPGFLIIGTEKGGTTAFFHHLALHPRIRPPRDKEICFFNKDTLHDRGTEWYHSQFPLAPLWSSAVTCEASPAYLYYPGVAGRIARYAPRMKLIAMLRDPVKRAYSAWNMHRQIRERNWDVVLQRLSTQPDHVRDAMIDYYDSIATNDFTRTVRTLIDRIDDDRVEPGLLKRGLYARQIAEYRRHFPANQMLILESTRCRDHLSAELDRVADFLGIERVDWDGLPVAEESKHTREYADPMPEEARALLLDLYRQPNEELFTMLHERYEWNG